jgi:hypothetical protein
VSRHHKSRLGCRLNAGGVEWAERHGCRESRPPPWMADGGGPTERRRSEGTRGTRAQPGARTLGYLGSFQVTRRRRNRSGVSQIPISRAAITWCIQISSCTRNPMEVVRQPMPRSDDGGRSGDSFATDPPPRCRRDLRRLPQRSRQVADHCSLLILLLSARYPRHHKSRLGCRLNAGGVEWAERHGCRESRIGPWMALLRRAHGASPSLRNPTKEGQTRSKDTWLLGGGAAFRFSSNSPKAKQVWR